ncbi:MAG: glycine C-acetyltransferase [Planctomycetota bacterium]
MSVAATVERVGAELGELAEAGLFKSERLIDTPQRPDVVLADGRPVLNLCANNYLGLAGHPAIIASAHEALDRWGYGMASVRFICGTQPFHKTLEQEVSRFLGTEDTILYSSCFDANGGLFETLLGPEDAIVSDALNHASIIDGVRLCKAKRYRYANRDTDELRAKLREAEAAGARTKMITTDGVFSMDGSVAKLDEVCDVADEFGAIVHFDDCHATGFVGPTGRGTHEACGTADRVDLTTGTFGKALGGASGGYTSGRREFIELLRQKSRPYLFSNTLAPPIVGGTLKALEIAAGANDLRAALARNTLLFREEMARQGFEIAGDDHPIVPVMLGDAKRAVALADKLLELGTYAVGFCYPVVPLGAARVRVQVSAAHSTDDLRRAVSHFVSARASLD